MSNRLDYFFKQPVTEAELDLGFKFMEDADRFIVADFGLTGIISGGVATEHSPVADLTVDLTGPLLSHSPQGERIAYVPAQTVDLSIDNLGVSTDPPTPTFERIVSLFVKFDRTLSDPRLDGASQSIFFRQDESFKFFVTQGAEAAAGTAVPPPLEADGLLVVDVTLTSGQTQILNANLDIARRQEVTYARADQISVVDNFPNLPAVNNVQETLEALDVHAGLVEDAHGANETITSKLLIGRSGAPTALRPLEVDMDGTASELILLHDAATELSAGLGGKGLRLSSAPGAGLGSFASDVLDEDIGIVSFLGGIPLTPPLNAPTAPINARGMFTHGSLSPGDGLEPTRMLLTPKDTIPSTVFGTVEFYTGLFAAKVFDVNVTAGRYLAKSTNANVAILSDGGITGTKLVPSFDARAVALGIDQRTGINKGQMVASVAKVDSAGVLVGTQWVNIDSITKNGTGDYTINFDLNHTDGNYVAEVTLEGATGFVRLGTQTNATLQILTFDSSDIAADRAFHLTTIGVLV